MASRNNSIDINVNKKQSHNTTFRTFDESVIPTSETFLESTNINSLGCTQRTNYCENDIGNKDRSKINSFVQLLKKDHKDKEKKSKVGNFNIKGSINHVDRQKHVDQRDNISKD